MARSKKNAARLGAHLVFADESGFLLAPLVAKTWAPRGCTPILRHRRGHRDKISVISGISMSPQQHRLGLYYLLFYDNIAQEEVCVFLRELLRHLRGPVIVLLDNSSTHEGEPLQKLLRQHPRLLIEHFPSYAPELNPDEGVWSLAKRQLANGRPDEGARQQGGAFEKRCDFLLVLQYYILQEDQAWMISHLQSLRALHN
jgi:putative transposase